MSTLLDLRTALRLVLGDSLVAAYLWSDATLSQGLNDGVRAYSSEFPQEGSSDIVLVAAQRSYALPAECERVVRVELPEDDQVVVEGGGVYGIDESWVGERESVGSPGWPGYAPTLGYRVWGGNLLLMWDPAGGELLRVSYLGPHAPLSADVSVSSVPAGDEGLVLAWAAARVVEGVGVDWAKRREFEGGTGRTAGDAAALYRAEYTAGVRVRKLRVRGSRLVIR